jgi:hypothetical protein
MDASPQVNQHDKLSEAATDTLNRLPKLLKYFLASRAGNGYVGDANGIVYPYRVG